MGWDDKRGRSDVDDAPLFSARIMDLLLDLEGFVSEDALTPDGGREERIAAIKARLEKATPGPWRISMTGFSVKAVDDDMPIVATNPWGSAMTERQAEPWLENAEFIAHARDDVEYLLASPSLSRVRALEAEVKALKADNDHLHNANQGTHHYRLCNQNAATGPHQHGITCERCRAEEAEEKGRALEEENERLRKAAEADLEWMFSAGVEIARGYGDNIVHLHGEQLKHRFRGELRNLRAGSPPLAALVSPKAATPEEK